MAASSRIIFRTKQEVRRRLCADGGHFRIMLKIKEEDAEKLGQLRTMCGNAGRHRHVKGIGLVDRLPTQHSALYEKTLTRLSSRPPFTLFLNHPFHSTRGVEVERLKGTFNISFDVSSPILGEIGRDLLQEPERIPRINTLDIHTFAKRRDPALAPRFILVKYIPNLDDLHRKLEFAKQNFKRCVQSVSAVGLSLEFNPAYDRDPITGRRPMDYEKPPSQDFLFHGVDDNLDQEQESLFGIHNSSVVKTTVPKA
jgi:hypothetical protein